MTSPVLVTGGAGYIGSHTVRLLASQGRKVVVLDNLVYGHREAIVDESVELVVGEVGDKALLRDLFARHGFGAVVHFAAYAYVGESVTDPLKYYRNNTAEPLNLLEVDAGIRLQELRLFINLRDLRRPGIRSRSPRATRRTRSILTAAAS